MIASRRIVLSLFSLLLLFTIPLSAQTGVRLGLDFPLLSFPWGDVQFNPGVGMGIRMGYQFDEQFILSLNLTGSAHSVNNGSLSLYDPSNPSGGQSFSDWSMGGLFFDGKLFLGEPRTVRPFFLGEIGFGALTADTDNSLSGVAVGIGGGVEYFFAGHWSLNGTGVFRHSNYTRARFNGRSGSLTSSIYENALILQSGITYHF